MSSDSQDSEGEDLCIFRPTLIRELRNILDLYPDDGQILKELIQNAEDAGATVVKVLTDNRHFNQTVDERTLKKHPHLRFFKGPALCVYNDAEFSQSDWKGIRMLHDSIKKDDPLKVGRFGLGFKSVFHLTDRLVILSGDYLMYMDPFKGEDRYCNWRRIAGRKGKELQSILQSLGGAFGITESTFHAKGGHFPGTLFWFPLRLNASELSSTLYTKQNVENLLASFKAEAPSLLLFLNRVQRVQILARDETHDPEELFSVGIAQSCLRTVQNERDRFVQDIASAGTSLPLNNTFCITEVVMETNDYVTSQKSSDRWLVANYHCGQRQMSATLSQLCSDHDLCYRPYVGVAVPLTCRDEFQSQLFCFLPLPLDTRSPTGLPVHVHGYFALEQNRRHLKWPTADQLMNSAASDPPSRWNCLLVTELLPVVYQQALVRLLELCLSDPATFYKAWPDRSRVQDRWNPLLKPLYSKLMQQSVFFSHNLGGQWVCLQRAILQQFSQSFAEEVRNSVVKVFTANQQALVNLPQHVLNTLKQLGFLQGIPEITAAHVSQLIPNCLPQLLRLDKLNLLHYLSCHDSQLLLNQTLLPLADGVSFGTFRGVGSGQFPTFLCSRQLVALFPCLEAMFCDASVPPDIRSDLQRLANSGTLSLEELHHHDSRIPMLLENSLQARFVTGPRVLNASDTWAEQVWLFLASVRSLSAYSHLTLLPVQKDAHHVSLLPLNGCYISSSASGMPPLSAALAGALSRLGIMVLHELPDYVARHCDLMGNFINYPSTEGIFRAVQSVNDNPSLRSNAVRVFNTEATTDEKAALVHFLSSVGNSYSAPPSLFLQLNLFRAAFTNQNISLQQIHQIGPSDLPPISPPVSFLSCSAEERLAALYLGGTELSSQQIAQSIMERMCSQRNLYSEHDVIQFMKFFLQRGTLMSVSSLQSLARSIPFVRTGGGHLQQPENVYDPSSFLLQELFYSQRQTMFPSGEFAAPEMLKKLKKLGLRCEQELTPTDLITAANAVSNLWNKNDSVSAIKSAEALFQYLNKYSDNISSNTLKAMSTIQCLPCLQDEQRPDHYPKSLSIRASPLLVKLSDMYSYKLLAVLGSVAPVCRPDLNASIASRCVRQDAESRVVLQHLRNVTTQFQQCDVSQYKLILNQVFQCLAQNSHDPHVIMFLQSEKCILKESGECFAQPSDFWILHQPGDIDLRPYRFRLPVELQPMESLMLRCGSSQSQTDQVLQTVLHEIQSKHISHNVSHAEFNTDLQLVKQILEVLKKSQRAKDGSTLLPIIQEQINVLRFKPASECTVMPGMRRSNVPPDVGFEIHIVHLDVPSNTALDLGACQMKERALTGVEDLDFGYEQHEDLTTRLHNLLQESYTDGFSVPKELIQNADDACASKVCFLLDERENMHCRTNLIADEMASLQGPAIWAYNDAVFSKTDFENIIKLGAGTKKDDVSKVGRFGLGFNAVYNLTDVPCFLSGHILAMFDPQRRYLGKGAGLKLDFTRPINKALLSRMPEQFQPFQDMFGCTLRGPDDISYPGTLFRFPLRTAEQAVNNRLKSESYLESKRRDFLKMLLEKAGSLLLFTQNVREVEVFHIPSHCSDPNSKICLLTVKKTCLAAVVSQPQVRMTNSTVLQFMKENWTKQNSDIKIQQKLEIKVEVSAEASNVCGVEKSSSSLQWQVAWASGTGRSAAMALLEMDGLVPLAAVAISVSDQGLIPLSDNPSGFYNTGHLFCFLPLPEDLELSRTVLPVHVNGTFALKSDRRGLIVQTEDDLVSGGSSWNTALYSDAVCRSYLLLLQQVSKEAVADNDFGRYFDLWPRAGVQCLVSSFYHHLQTDGNKVLPVPGHNVWSSFSDAFFLEPHFRDSDSGWIAWNAVQRFWTGHGYLVDVPSDICRLMKNQGLPGAFEAKVTTKVAFYRDFFFPNLLSEWWKPEERDHLIYYAVMLNDKEINQLIKGHACIPCQGGKLLRRPSELVSPKGLIADLFLLSEQRFPQTAEQGSTQTSDDKFVQSKTDFCSDRTLYLLSNLGMRTDVLPWDMVLDRARSVGRLMAEQKVEESLRRASCLIKYLADHIDSRSPSALENCPSDIKQTLTQTAFLPVLSKPSEWPLLWAGAEAPHNNCLAPPADLCFESMKNLVACKKKLLDFQALALGDIIGEGRFTKVLRLLGVVVVDYSNMTLLECVLEQLIMIADQRNQTPGSSNLIQSVSSNIYAYLNRCLERNEGKTASQSTNRNEENCVRNTIYSKLIDKCFVWTGNMFVHSSSVAFICPFDCAPHLYQLGSGIQTYRSFFKAAGVKENFTVSDVLLVLERLNREASGIQLSSGTIDLISRIAQLLTNITKYVPHSEPLDTERVFLPDVHGFMRPASSLCVDDCNWLKGERMKLVNEKIPKETAKLLGAKTKQRQHLSMCTKPITYKPFGPFEKLTTRIGRLLEGYTFDSSLLKELIQNADDGQATEAKFIMDFRSLPTHKVPEKFEPFQGPALCFYNNKSFTAEDMQGIQNLGVGSKGQDDLKIGQFGVGFNAVYHITDIPSFWTKVDDEEDVICVLDPNCQYVPEAEPTKPGVQFSDLEEIKRVYPDFFSGYLDGAINTAQSGTLFRFPLRTDKMAESSEIKKQAVTKADIAKLLETFKDELSACLLFLNNLQTVGIYSVCGDGTLKQEFEVKKSVDEQGPGQLCSFKASLQEICLGVNQGRLSMKHIPVHQTVVLSKIMDSRGGSVDWLIVHRVGFIEGVTLSTELIHDWGKGNFRMLPRGGVAVKLKEEGPRVSENAVSLQRKCQAFCMLPLPVFTDLPVHVNGHFALDHETRRNLWDSGTSKDDIRSEWNDAIALQVIVPAYITALKAMKDKLFPGNGRGFSKPLMSAALKQYHDLFPQPTGNTFWAKLACEIYKTIAKEELPLFPVICAETTEVEWIPAVRRDGFPGYFSNLVSFKTDQAKEEERSFYTDQAKEEERKQQVFLTGGISASSDGRTSKPSASETAREMEDLLKRLNMKILEAPLHIYNSFKTSGVAEVQEVTPDNVVRFLRSSGQNVRSGCNIGGLPRPVSDTPLKTAKNVQRIVRFVSKAANFENQLHGLPLCLRQSETLHVFSKTGTVSLPILSKYCYLLPGSAEEFIHECIFRSFISLKETNDLMQKLSIPMFASRLRRSLTDPSLFAGQPCSLELNRFPPVPYGKTWLDAVWTFLGEELKKQKKTSEDASSAEYELHKTADEVLPCLSECCLIPVMKRSGEQWMHMLYPVKHLHQVVYLPSSDQRNPGLLDVLKNLSLPFLNLYHSVLTDLVASINHPRGLLHALASCSSQLSVYSKAGNVILDYFKNSLQILNQSCLDARQLSLLKRELKSLPVFPAVGGKRISLSEAASVLCLDESIPENGLEHWSYNGSPMLHLLRAKHVPKTLQEFLQFRSMTVEQFYFEYLLPTLEYLPREAIVCHMAFLRNQLKDSWNSPQSLDLVQQLKATAFVIVCGSLHRAGEFFSPHVTVFQTMCSRDQFPPEPYNSYEWKQFMTAAGMVSEVTDNMFLHYARAVEIQGRMEGITQDVAKKSQTLVKHLFGRKRLTQSNLLPQVKTIRFILPSDWTSSQEGQQLVKIASPLGPARLVSYSESASEQHLYLLWSSSWVLASYAHPRHYCHDDSTLSTVMSLLDLHQYPPKEKVIQHLKNVSHSLAGERGPDIFVSLQQNLLVNIMDDVYKYLEKNIVSCDIPVLKQVPLVCDPENKRMLKPVSVVIDLQQREMIRGHIEKAPLVFGRYSELFKKLGATQSVTADHYAQFLAWLKTKSGDESLHVEEMKLVKTALEGLFRCLKEGLETQKRITVSELYVPTERESLQNSTEVVYKDRNFGNRFHENVLFFIGFIKLEMNVTKPLEEINLLPRQYQMVMLSRIVREIIPDSVHGNASEGRLSRDLMARLGNPLTTAAIVRLVYHKHFTSERAFSSESAQDIQHKLSNVFVKEIAGLRTVLTLRGREVPGSESCRRSFVDKIEGTPRRAIVYIDAEGIGMIVGQDQCFRHLVIAVNFVLGENLNEALLIQILKNPADAQNILDQDSIVHSNFLPVAEESVFPPAGKFVPLHHHCYLDNSFYHFRKGEHVGYEVYDPAVTDQEEGFHDAVYIYAIVLEEVTANGEGNIPLLARRYLINLGPDRGEAEVSATELYKFFRRPTGSNRARNECTDMVRHQRHFVAEDLPSADMKAVLREIRAILSEAWQQFPEEKDRRRVVKRLLLKWHPDRNHGNEKFCTRVTQKILHYADLLNKGKSLPSEDEESQGNVPSPRTSSMFNNFYANMTSRARTYQANYDSGPQFSRSRSHQSDDNFHERDSHFSSSRHGDQHPLNPQPGEARRWFRQAKADVAAAQAAKGLCDRGHNWVCYQCHQAVEKAMKAVIYFRDSDKMFMMSHDIRQLALIVDDSDIIGMVRSLEDRIGPHTRMRYPNVLVYPHVPADEYSEGVASWACDVAMRVLQRVQSLIEV